MTAIKSILLAALVGVSLAGCKSATVNQSFEIEGRSYSTESVVRVERFRGRYGWEGTHPGRCGGVLVADKVVLTAAHCVSGYGYRSDSDLVDVVLADGTRSGLDAMVVSPDFYQKPGSNTNADSEDDWAVLLLKKPFGAGRSVEPFYFTGDYIRPHYLGPFMQAGFTKDARIKNLYPACEFVKHWTRVIESDCPVSHGDSGGPMFYLLNGKLFVVAVSSAKGGGAWILHHAPDCRAHRC